METDVINGFDELWGALIGNDPDERGVLSVAVLANHVT